jgi:hypothetical protein
MIYQVKNKTFIDFQSIKEITGLSKTTIHRLLKETKKIKYGNKFLFETNSFFNSIMNQNTKRNHIRGFDDFMINEKEKVNEVELEIKDLEDEESQSEPETNDEETIEDDEKLEKEEISMEQEFNERFDPNKKKIFRKK